MQIQSFKFSYHNIGALLLVICAVLFPLLSLQYGVTWDERLSIEYSNDVINYFLSGGSDKTCLDIAKPVYNHLIYYGNIFGIITNLLHRIIPIDIMMLRHLVCSLLAVLTLFYTWRIVQILSGNFQALLLLILMLLSPRFIGYSMNDFRDVTFMLGYVMALYFYIKLDQDSLPLKRKLAVGLALGIFIASSVRIGGLMIIPAIGIHQLYQVFKLRKTAVRAILLKKWLSYSIIFISAYILTVLIWPWAHQDVFLNPIKALQSFSDLSLINSYQLYFGELQINREVPYGFLFTWIGITYSIVMLIGLFLSLFFIRKWTKISAPMVFLLLPFVLYFLSSRNFYDACRQFLFLFPPLAIVSSSGWKWTIDAFEKKTYRLVVISIFWVICLLPLISIIRMHPAETTYFNEIIGGVDGAYGHFEIETDGNTVRQAADWLNDHLKENKSDLILLASNHEERSVLTFIDSAALRKNIRWIAADQLYQTDWDYAIVSLRGLNKYELRNEWPYSESIFDFKVEGVPIVSVLKRRNSYLKEGVSAITFGNISKAIDVLSKAVERNPRAEINHRYLGLAYFRMNDYKMAQKYYNAALDINPNSPTLLYFVAELNYNQANYAKAGQFVDKSLEYRADMFESICLHAKITFQISGTPAAKKELEDLTKSRTFNSNQSSLIYNCYGELILMDLEKTKAPCYECVDEAIKMFEKSVQANKRNITPYQNLIAIYSFLGKDEYVKYTEDLLKKNLGLTK